MKGNKIMLREDFVELISKTREEYHKLHMKELEELNKLIENCNNMCDFMSVFEIVENDTGIDLYVKNTKTCIGGFSTISKNDIYDNIGYNATSIKKEYLSKKQKKEEDIYFKICDLMKKNPTMILKEAIIFIHENKYSDLTKETVETYYHNANKRRKE